MIEVRWATSHPGCWTLDCSRLTIVADTPSAIHQGVEPLSEASSDPTHHSTHHYATAGQRLTVEERLRLLRGEPLGRA